MVYERCYRTIFMINIMLAFISSTSAAQEGFYAVAHMTNGYKAVKFAMDAGANAVELDLMFNSKTGRPTQFYHGSPCDCTCIVLSSDLCSLYKHPCNTASYYQDMLEYLLQFPNLALVYLDSKIGDFPVGIQKQAARNIINLINEALFKKGYKGKVLIGGGKDKPYLSAVAHYSKSSLYASRIYVTLDWNKKGYFDSLNFLSNLPTHNVVFSDGHSFCYPRTYHKSIRTAAANKMNDVISKVFVWTVDITESFNIYYRNGARGILTNKIKSLMSWVRDNDIRLAVPGDDSLMPATSKHIINPSCDCDYGNGGCSISKLPPTNMACRCKKTILRCDGYVVTCKDPDSMECKHPGYTVQTCIQGGGNCDGYKYQNCDCSYKLRWGGGGCKVTTPAPIHTACKCSKGLLSCHGHVVSCGYPNKSHCRMPDTSKASCALGGGNCDGY